MSPDAFIRNSKFAAALTRRVLSPLNDRQYLAVRYFFRFGRWPDYAARRDFNECIHEYMLRCRDPLLKVVADKFTVRRYIEEQGGNEFLVPCVGVWDHPSQIPLTSLPRPVVLKATVGSGMNVFLRRDEAIDESGLRHTMDTWFRSDFSKWNREWCYAGLPQRVIAEEMLSTAEGKVPSDIKFYVVGGAVRFIQVDRDRFGSHTRNLYSSDWDLLPVRLTKRNHERDPAPLRLRDMVAVAERLARPFEFLRVDYYAIGDRLYIGELTNYSGSGFETFIPSSYGHQLAAWWKEGSARLHGADAGLPSAAGNPVPAGQRLGFEYHTTP